ncbi:hypothetical protein DFH06DRAFT_1339335 [Mycena polygramma]|nr:hypothetical protein DFH06DRAFT_1339335 [Mycena polygramma]
MATTSISLREVLREQTARTRTSSKTRIKELIEECESKTDSIESQIAALVDQRDRERTTASALRWIIAPVRTLPVELLVEIFLLTLSNDSVIQDAFRVSHVCSDWRRIAQGALLLWKGPIEIQDDIFLRSEDAYVDGVKTWLARSAPLCIPVRIDTQLSVLLEAVQSIAPRIQSLVVGRSVPFSFFRRLADHGLDTLEELNLQDLALRGAVTELALNILSQCRNLVMTTIAMHGGVPIHARIVSLNHLRTLSVQFTSTASPPFLESISAPNVENLDLYFRYRAAARLTGFPNITRLALTKSTVTSADLRTALVHAPLLTHLLLTDCVECTDDTLLVALSHIDGAEPLMPHLHVLELVRIGKFSQKLFTDMIVSRWYTGSESTARSPPRAVARWTCVHLKCAPEVKYYFALSDEFVDKIQDLERQGLRITVDL